MMKTFGRIVAVSAALVLTLSDPIGGQKPVSDASLRQHAVRVRSTGGSQSKASSGFVYLQHGQVVTTLHTVVGGVKFEVICRGEFRSATLEKFHVASDLALLRVAGGPFSNCLPVQAANVFNERPPDKSPLYLAGTSQDREIGTRKMDLLSMDPPETLERLLNDENLKGVRADGLPSVTLPIYHVQGGLLPGFSGAPVFDPFGRLVAIANGGLNRGADNYNWLVPASNLKTLMDAPTGAAVPSGLARNGASSMSAALAEDNSAPSGTGTSAGRLGRDVFANGAKAGDLPKAHWMKRLSAAELARTSDDPDAFDGLLRAIRNAGKDATFDRNQEFDIYEDASHGLIFAAPANWRVDYYSQFATYYVNDPRHDDPPRLRFSRVRFEIRLRPNEVLMAGDGSGTVLPSDARYFKERIDEDLSGRTHPDSLAGDVLILAGSARSSEFANGNKVMRFASLQNGTPGYHMWAVRGNDVLATDFTDYVAKADDATFLTIAFALNLTTFHDPGGKRSPVREFRTDHVPGFTDPSTKGAIYDDEAASRMPKDDQGPPTWRFFNKRGKLWEVPSVEYLKLGGKAQGPLSYPFVEIGRKQGVVYLRNNNIQYAVPVIGGTYHVSRDGGPLQPAGVIRRRPQ